MNGLLDIKDNKEGIKFKLKKKKMLELFLKTKKVKEMMKNGR
jgi:hypothetical protein